MQYIEKVSITKTQIERYNVRVGYNWATFAIGKDGNFMVNSSYGNYAYYWGNHGCESFKHFLIQMSNDTGYLINKLAGGKRETFKHALTIQNILGDIIKSRREFGITQEEARGVYDFVKELNDKYHTSADIFTYEFYHSGYFDLLYHDFDSFPLVKEYDFQLTHFIEKFYPILIGEFKGELGIA